MSTSTARRLAGALAVLAAPLAAQRLAPADAPPLWSVLASAPGPAVLHAERDRAADPTIAAVEFVRVDPRALDIVPGSVLVTLGGTPVVLDLRRRELVLGREVVSGEPRGGSGEVDLVLAGDGIVTGTLRVGERWYVLRHAGHPGVHALYELDATRPTHPLLALPAPAAVTGGGGLPADGPGTAAATTDTLLDLMVFYTPAARTRAGGRTAVEGAIIAAVARANATNRNSNVAVEFRLVHLAETNYAENGTSNDLSRFRGNGDGYMDEVHTLRPRFGADLMHLITAPSAPAYCGVAYLMTSLSTGFRGAAFAVTVFSCLGGNTMAHEIGHNIGCHHDRNNAGGAIYPYAYGFRTADSRYRTTMAYSPGSRVDVWSSPQVTYGSYTMGVANSEDNARTITNTRTTVAAFYATRVLTWCQVAGGVPGLLFRPVLAGSGTIDNYRPIELTVTNFLPNAPGALVIGFSELGAPAFGGTLVPAPHVALPISGPTFGQPIVVNAAGLSTAARGSSLWFQAAFIDGTAVQGVAMTDGLRLIVP